MNLHFGGGEYVPLDCLVCVVDATDMAADTKRYIGACAKQDRLRPCEGKPKSYLITRDEAGREIVFASPIGARALRKRWTDACLHDNIKKLAHLTVEEP